MTKRNDARSGYRCAVKHREAQTRYLLTRAGREQQRDRTMRRSVLRGEDRISVMETELGTIFDEHLGI
jgi:hypothetical protein